MEKDCTDIFLTPEDSLTPRELAVVEYVLDGYNNLAIAMNLGIKEVTVKQHLYRAFQKVGVGSRLDLAVKILKDRHKRERET